MTTLSTDRSARRTLRRTTKRRERTVAATTNPAVEQVTEAVASSRADTLIALMRADGGATAAELASAIGWQPHSVRGFIAGKLKKRPDLVVTATRHDGGTRYAVSDAEAVEA